MIEDVLEALLARCVTLAVGSPPLPKAYPEADFTPPADGRYLEIRILPNSPAWEGVTKGLLAQGILQIDTHWPKKVGVIQAAKVVDAVGDHFPKGLKLHHGGVVVTLTNEPVPGSPLSDDRGLVFPLTLRWSAAQG